MERRRGGRKRLLRRERMRMARVQSDSASSGRAECSSVLTKGALRTLHSAVLLAIKKLSLQHHTFVMAPRSEDLNPQMNLS